MRSRAESIQCEPVLRRRCLGRVFCDLTHRYAETRSESVFAWIYSVDGALENNFKQLYLLDFYITTRLLALTVSTSNA